MIFPKRNNNSQSEKVKQPNQKLSRLLVARVYPKALFLGLNLEINKRTCEIWQCRSWSIQGKDTKLESFLAKNQLQSNEITKFGELE